VAPYLALVHQDAPQRTHELREVFNGLHWIVRRSATVGGRLPADEEVA
jgi:hypothetical protein